ncbi:MAG TPA: MmgE/PrpD family protein [Magnetospirillaceae bacterium]|jgi:2-methylcitrate dehydratase PrpD
MSGAISQRLGLFVSNLRFESLSADLVAVVCRILLDDIGSMIGGFREPEISNLAHRLSASSERPEATILGAGFPRADAAWAALANGTAGVGLETDGGYRLASCHASSYVIPAALALAEATGANGRQLIEAIVAGYDVAARLAAATTLARPLMPHGVWSAPGAAAAAARLLNLDGRAAAAAIELSVLTTNNGAFTGRFEGATVRNTYNGFGGQSGILAAELAGRGMPVEIDAVGQVFGALSGSAFDIDRATESLGETYAIGFHYHKRWSCCGFIHASLDAVAEMMAEQAISDTDIESIEVGTFPEGAALFDQTPTRPLAARHSVPWAIAALIRNGSLTPDVFATEALANPDTRRLASKIRVFSDSTLPSGFSKQRSARVSITFRDGRRRSHVCKNVQGDFSTPFTDSVHLKKFLSLAEPSLGAARANRLAEALLMIDRAPDIRAVLGEFSQPPVGTKASTGAQIKTSGGRKEAAPDYLDRLCDRLLDGRSDTEMKAAAVAIETDRRAIDIGRRVAIDRGYFNADGRLAWQGGGAPGAALRAALAAALAVAPSQESAVRLAGSAAVLTLAELSPELEPRLVRAVACGCELARSLEDAVTLRASYAGVGLWGVMATAAACAVLKGFDHRTLRETLNVAASLSIAVPDTCASSPLSVAEASFRGLLATELVEAGYNGLRDGVGFTLGELVGRQFERARVANERRAAASA